MECYGSDKFDIWFGLELVDVFDLVKDFGFKVFFGVVVKGGIVKVLFIFGGNDVIFNVRIKFGGDLFKEVSEVGVKGLVYVCVKEGDKIDIIGVIKDNFIDE